VSRLWTTARVALVLLVAVGGLITWRSFAGAPATKIATAGRADHRRALRLANARSGGQGSKGSASSSSSLGTSSTGSAATTSWHPTITGQVASLTIVALGVHSAPVLAESVSGGYLTIPTDVHNVGWDSQTPAPGQAGITVLAGHVNWVGQGEGSLGEIGQLVPGDRILVDWGGRVSTWSVLTRPAVSPNTEVHTFLFKNTGPPRLALVTCGGPFRETSSGGSYADNVIVEAVPAAA
jgi:sortase (surface protein transpeptidase)